MIARAVVACALLAGCTDPEVGLPGVSCEQTHHLLENGPPPELDLVIAVSDATSMTPYRDRLLEQLEVFGFVIADGAFDVHVTLVDIGGPTAGDEVCGLDPVVPYFKDWQLPWWDCPDGACGQRNYEGDLGVRLACAAPPSNQSQPTPLIQRVTDTVDEPGFARPDAILGMILIGFDDDASPQPVGVYLDRIRRSRTEPERIWVATVNGPNAPRLAALRDAFDGSITVPIADDEWAAAASYASFRMPLLGSCLDDQGVIDLDDDEPGIQPECVVRDEGDVALPHCRMAGPALPDPDILPCYWIDYTQPGCSAPMVERAHRRPNRTASMSCACDL